MDVLCLCGSSSQNAASTKLDWSRELHLLHLHTPLLLPLSTRTLRDPLTTHSAAAAAILYQGKTEKIYDWLQTSEKGNYIVGLISPKYYAPCVGHKHLSMGRVYINRMTLILSQFQIIAILMKLLYGNALYMDYLLVTLKDM